MYKATNRQRGLFEAEHLLHDGARRRLRSSWADGFSSKVFPILLEAEDELASLYGEVGRPNWSIARMLGVCLLRELSGLPSDQAAVDALTFDLRWQHALGLRGVQEAYLSRRSLADFRSRLAKADPESKFLDELFKRIGEAAIKDLGLSTAEQRLDSTFIRSNIAHRGRRALIRETLEMLLSLVAEAGQLDSVEESIQTWYAHDRGWERRSLPLQTLGLWLRSVLRQFADQAELAKHADYQTAQQVMDQHLKFLDTDGPPDDEPPGGDSAKSPVAKASKSKKKRRRRRKTAKRRGGQQGRNSRDATANDEPAPLVEADTSRGVDRIQSLHDQDARLGHKGTGYTVQVAETCRNEHAEILTHVGVQPANSSDVAQTDEIVGALQSQFRDFRTVNVDAGYTSADTLFSCQQRGIELRGPVTRLRSNDALTREDFTFASDGRVTSCPAGHAPVGHTHRTSSASRHRSLHVVMSAQHCSVCSRRDRCLVQGPKRATYIANVSEPMRLRDQRLAEQQQPAWHELYATRSGIEGTNSELKRAHHLGQLTVRGRENVLRRVLLKTTAANIKRWFRGSMAA